MKNTNKLIKELKAWSCKECGLLIYHSKKPTNCSCGNKNSYFEDSQVTSLAKRQFDKATIQTLLSCKKDELEFLERIDLRDCDSVQVTDWNGEEVWLNDYIEAQKQKLIEEIKETNLVDVISMGYLVDENKERIAVCPFIFPNDLVEDRNVEDRNRESELMIGYRDTHFIPKSQIIKIINLKHGKL